MIIIKHNLITQDKAMMLRELFDSSGRRTERPFTDMRYIGLLTPLVRKIQPVGLSHDCSIWTCSGQGDYHPKHIDNAAHTPWRKVTAMLYLNDSQGGDLRLDDNVVVRPEPGLAVVFLSCIPHETTPVSHGLRYSISNWWR